MTEEQWLAATDPTSMLEALRASGAAADRKLRLFACGCVRRVWDLIPPQETGDWRAAVEKAEEYADGLLTLDQMWGHAILSRLKAEREFGPCRLFLAGAAARAASNWSDAEGRWCHRRERCVGFSAGMAASAAAGAAEAAAYHAALPDWTGQDIVYSNPEERPSEPAWLAALAAEQRAQAALLREVLGNPFRPYPAIERSLLDWHGGLVVQLALAAYEQRQLPSGTLEPDRLAVLADALEDAGCGDEQILVHLRSAGPHVRGCWAVDLVLGRG
jgi:hypothetical protein